MGYKEDDAAFPVQAGKVRLAKKRFIEKGSTDIVNLASMIGIDPQYLKNRAEDENWSEVRFQGLMTAPSDKVAAFEKKLAKEPDAMERHAMVADFLVDMAFGLAKALSSGDLTYGNDMSFLRSKIEALKSLTEAAVESVDMARKVRGIEDGTPSSGRVQESTHVHYEVSIGPEEKSA